MPTLNQIETFIQNRKQWLTEIRGENLTTLENVIRKNISDMEKLKTELKTVNKQLELWDIQYQ